MKKQFTEQQLKNYRAYEKVRFGGRYNMFHPHARMLSGLEKEDYLFVMSNYSELRDAAEAAEKSASI